MRLLKTIWIECVYLHWKKSFVIINMVIVIKICYGSIWYYGNNKPLFLACMSHKMHCQNWFECEWDQYVFKMTSHTNLFHFSIFFSINACNYI